MLFSSTVFLLVFLPVVTILYYALPWRRARNLLLLLASLLFYAWGRPRNLLLLLFAIAACYGFGLWLGALRKRNRPTGLVLALGLTAELGLLFVFKYLNFTVTQLNRLGLPLSVPRIALPIGISFFTFQAASYLIDVRRGRTPAQKNPLDLALYIALFPQLIAGPIVKYHSVADQIRNRKESWSGFAAGIRRFLVGLCKKVLLANTLGVIADGAFAAARPSAALAWLGLVSYTLQIYYDFSGYSDMAIGLGGMFGFRFAENFRWPYAADSIRDFWRRWHISLSDWFKDYVYFPMGGSRVRSRLRLLLNLLVVWMLTGIWHGANWTYLTWGLLQFVLLELERRTGVTERVPGWLRRPFILVLILLSMGIFRSDSLTAAWHYAGALFGAGGATEPVTGFYLREYGLNLAAGLLFAVPTAPRLKQWAEGKSWGGVLQLLSGIGLLVLYLVVLASLVKGTYNPFIYFNF